ncbi:MAG: FHA domain-containing protein [Desulfovibrio sp.]|nr:FHA domain-containing protein [Desulfovibrio sp.]MBI4958456.1 FHA domain-containing protein [Desulfovibrio sp.]
MDDRTRYSAPAASYLLVKEGPGQGRMFLLLDGETTIGRAPENTIVLDPGDVKASRRHALIRVEAGLVSVEDLGSKNGTLLDGKAVTKAPLAPGAELCVGETVFVLSHAGQEEHGAEDGEPSKGVSKPGRRKVLYVAVAVLAVGALFLAIMGGGKEGGEAKKQGATGQAQQTQTSQAQPGEVLPPQAPAAIQGKTIQSQTADGQAPQTQPGIQSQTEQSMESMRLGQFYYNSGKLKKAVEQWREAVRQDPGNAQASKLLVRAEGELDQLVDKHYRQALLALRYQRTEEAKAELRQVVENSPNPDDERTRDSLKKLDELGGR